MDTSPLQPWKYSTQGAEVVTVSLRRLNTLERLVRYERMIVYSALVPCHKVVEYGPAFNATLQEWERAIPLPLPEAPVIIQDFKDDAT